MILILLLVSIFLLKKLYDILGNENDIYYFSGKKNPSNAKEIEIIKIEEIQNSEEDQKKDENIIIKTLDQESFVNYTKIKERIQNFNLDLFLEISKNIVSIVIENLNKKEEEFESKIKNITTDNFYSTYIEIKKKLNYEIFLIFIEKCEIKEIQEKNDIFIINLKIRTHQQSKQGEKLEKIISSEIWQFINYKDSHKWLLNNITENE